jgi:uncharacterized membrane protein
VIKKKQPVHRSTFMICSDVGKGMKSFIRGTESFISCVMYMDIGFAKVHWADVFSVSGLVGGGDGAYLIMFIIFLSDVIFIIVD